MQVNNPYKVKYKHHEAQSWFLCISRQIWEEKLIYWKLKTLKVYLVNLISKTWAEVSVLILLGSAEKGQLAAMTEFLGYLGLMMKGDSPPPFSTGQMKCISEKAIL